MENFFYETRSKLHKNPELALEEYETARYIRNFLDNLEIEYEEIGTSTLALFKGKEDLWLGFRADIDALPLQEENEVEYKSKVNGKMHACGHDGHTTNLLYFAKWLKEQMDSGVELKKSIMLIFQAGEEGKIAIAHGALSFQNINLDIEIVGKGCHGAQPHQGIDSILVGAKLVETYQSIVSRNIDPLKAVIVTIGSFKAGEVRNVIPEKVNILGTIRLIDTSLIEFIRERVTSINEGLERAFGVKINMNFMPFYPPVINSEDLYKIVESSIPEDQIVRDIRLTGSEDFSFYLQNGNKGFMFLLGVRNEEKGFINPLHSPKFDFDPNTLRYGFEVFKNILEKMNVI